MSGSSQFLTVLHRASAPLWFSFSDCTVEKEGKKVQFESMLLLNHAWMKDILLEIYETVSAEKTFPGKLVSAFQLCSIYHRAPLY